MNELSLIDELDETENKFILFVEMVSIILGSPKKMVTKIYDYGVRACLNNPKKIKWCCLLGFWVQFRILSTIGSIKSMFPLHFVAWLFNACNNFCPLV
jgi:hypothetical protein